MLSSRILRHVALVRKPEVSEEHIVSVGLTIAVF
jgi:hypothetical protein